MGDCPDTTATNYVFWAGVYLLSIKYEFDFRANLDSQVIDNSICQKGPFLADESFTLPSTSYIFFSMSSDACICSISCRMHTHHSQTTK